MLLNRMLCLLQPFEQLRRCGTRAKNTLDLRYSSLPPQLTIWRAFRARHYLLVLVGVTALSSNILAVALGGLFNTAITDFNLQAGVSPAWQPQINSSPAIITEDPPVSYFDHFYLTNTNISNHTQLPAWTTKDTSFLPISLKNDTNMDGKQYYNLKTDGFGVRTNCIDVTDSANASSIRLRATNTTKTRRGYYKLLSLL